MAKVPLALQMYTVRDHTASDYAGTYRKVAAMGYEGVEIAGDGGLSAAEMKSLLDECGFARCGSHIGLPVLQEHLQAQIDYNLEIGNKFVVVPWIAEQLRSSADDWRKTAEVMGQIGSDLKAAGLQLCYHNHAFEFEVKEGDTYGLDIFYQAAPADLVMAEIDTYWVKFAGCDPAAYVAKYKHRAPLIHLKDMTPPPDPTFTEVGTGTLDFPAIMQAAEGGNVVAWIVEQDRCQGDALESAETSLKNLKQLIG